MALAPEEPYAKKMLETLRGQEVEADTTIGLVDLMITERLFDSALRQGEVLLAEKALTDQQRAEVMTLRARALLGKGQAKQVQVTVHELLAKYPAEAKAAATTLLLGQAKILMGGENVPEGLTLLRKVVAERVTQCRGYFQAARSTSFVAAIS